MLRFLPVLMLLITACESGTVVDDGKRLVIEAFLYEGQPVKNVQIRELVPLLSEDNNYRISEAEVVINSSDNQQYTLFPNDRDEGFYYSDILKVERGVTYALEVRYEDQLVTSETSVPGLPRGLDLGVDTLFIQQITDFADLGSNPPQDLIVTWENPENQPFFVQVDNIEDEGNIINLTLPNGQTFGGGFRLVTEPTTADNYVLRTRTMEDYGLYQIVLFSLNQEYLDLYETSGEDSRSFSEPLTNIENGLGIFTAFSSDTTYLRIVPL